MSSLRPVLTLRSISLVVLAALALTACTAAPPPGSGAGKSRKRVQPAASGKLL